MWLWFGCYQLRINFIMLLGNSFSIKSIHIYWVSAVSTILYFFFFKGANVLIKNLYHLDGSFWYQSMQKSWSYIITIKTDWKINMLKMLELGAKNWINQKIIHSIANINVAFLSSQQLKMNFIPWEAIDFPRD